jgi:hypothetical protein
MMMLKVERGWTAVFCFLFAIAVVSVRAQDVVSVETGKLQGSTESGVTSFIWITVCRLAGRGLALGTASVGGVMERYTVSYGFRS